MTPEELKEIEERCNKAKPGPWSVFSIDYWEGEEHPSPQIWANSPEVPIAEVIKGEWGDAGIFCGKISKKSAKANSLFIAHAREDIPKLLGYIKELQHEIEMLSASPDETSSHCGTFLEEREGLK